MAYKLKGKIQHYAWGGYSYIPRLLHMSETGHQPCAEYWLGAHEKSPADAQLKDGHVIPLSTLIGEHPEKYLGAAIAHRFGRLPFLFKVLDVRDMLSIQVHPTKSEAEEGFARENKAGIPLDAPERNYKDDNHKPEMMVALSAFYLLHGFRPEADLHHILREIPELNVLESLFNAGGYYGLYKAVMQWPQQQINAILLPLLGRILPLYAQGQLAKHHPDFWAAKAVDSGISTLQQPDRGILSIYLFNLMQLEPGQGIFQAAGIPHAYLEGQNVELMANSDNVLRGGLTPKHVDVPELLNHTRFEGVIPRVLRGENKRNGTTVYPAEIPDFSLRKMSIAPMESIDNQTIAPEIFLIISGKVLFSTGQGITATLHTGDSFFVPPGEIYSFKAMENTLIFNASVHVK